MTTKNNGIGKENGTNHDDLDQPRSTETSFLLSTPRGEKKKTKKNYTMALVMIMIVMIIAVFAVTAIIISSRTQEYKEKSEKESAKEEKPKKGKKQKQSDSDNVNTTVCIILLSHDVKPTGGENTVLDDFNRPLTAKGIKSATELGTYLHENHVPQPNLIYASPSNRTRATLQLVEDNWIAKTNSSNKVSVATPPIKYRQELYDGGKKGSNYDHFILENIIHNDEMKTNNYHRIMIVGHNEATEEVANHWMLNSSIIQFTSGAYCEFHWPTWNKYGTSIPEIGVCTANVTVAPKKKKHKF